MGLSDIFIYSGSTPLRLILWSFYIAIVISTIYMYITKVKFGKLIYALMEKEAFSPESALTLDEIGIKAGIFVKIGLKNHLNYKNLLVAITEDGRYYANTAYIAEPPTFRTLVAITRKKRSRISENKTDDDNTAPVNDTSAEEACTSLDLSETGTSIEASQITENCAPETPSENTDHSLRNHSTNQETPPTKPERVKFDIFTAKYYIPSAIHAKVRSLYNDSSVKLRWIILILIGLGIITYFAGFVVEGLVDMLKNFGE